MVEGVFVDKHPWLRWLVGLLLAVLLFVVGVFVWFGQGLPEETATTQSSPATAWMMAAGQVRAVSQVSADGSSEALQLQLGEQGDAMAALDAPAMAQINPSIHRFLRMQVHEWPTDVRVYAMWQSMVDGKPQRGRVLLPKVAEGLSVVDLTQDASWQGSLKNVVLMAVPESMLPDQAVRDQSLRLGDISWLPDTRRNRLMAWWQRVTSPRMWVGKSINTQGFENDVRGDRSQTLVALWLFVAVLVGASVAMNTLNKRVWLFALCVSWGALMLLECRQQWLRVWVQDAQVQAVANMSDDRARLAAIPYLTEAADAVRALHQQRGGGERIVVQANANHNGLYLSYLLRPLNVAFERSQRALSHAPKEAHLLVTTDPKFDEWHQKLKQKGFQRELRLLKQGAGWQIFAVPEEAKP